MLKYHIINLASCRLCPRRAAGGKERRYMDQNDKNKSNKNNDRRKGVLSLLIWALVLTIGFNYLLSAMDTRKLAESTCEIRYDEFLDLVRDGKVKEVKVNPTLQEHPVTLTAEGGISMEMEKVLRRMPNAEGVESTKVLELNPNHTVFAALKAAHAAGDADKVAKYAELLYDQALLIAGLPIEDPVAYAQLVCGLMQ